MKKKVVGLMNLLKFLSIFLVVFLVGCAQLETIKDDVEKRYLSDEEDKLTDLTLRGRDADLNVNLQSRFADKAKSGNVKFETNFGGADFQRMFTGNPILIQYLYVPNADVMKFKFGPNEIQKAIDSKRGVISSFEVTVDRKMPARLSSELSYRGYSRAKLNGCVAIDEESYYSKCGKLGRNLIDQNIGGSEFRVNDVYVDSVDSNKYVFYISFTKSKDGVVSDLSFSFENFPYLNSYSCSINGGSGIVKWDEDFKTGETYCALELSNGIDFTEDYKKFDGYFWMNYDYKLKKDLVFEIEP